MRFHCPDGLVVTHICTVAHLRENIGVLSVQRYNQQVLLEGFYENIYLRYIGKVCI